MDRLTRGARSANMRAIRSKNMKPELTVRRLVHSLGCRYRLHRADLPGKPDLVLSSRRTVIFVHGCFWHSHGCRLSHVPKSNLQYWLPKLTQNKSRDEAHLAALKADGWRVIVVWECELQNSAALKNRLRTSLLDGSESMVVVRKRSPGTQYDPARIEAFLEKVLTR